MECLVVPLLVFTCVCFLDWLNNPQRKGVDLQDEIFTTLSDGEWWYVPDIAEVIYERFREERGLPLRVKNKYIRRKLAKMYALGMVELGYGENDEFGDPKIRYRIRTSRRRPPAPATTINWWGQREPLPALTFQRLQTLPALTTLIRVVFFI